MVDSLQSPKITRSRTKPNLQVTEEQYKDALHALLVAEPPLLDMRSKLGPVLAKHVKQVTPGQLVSLEKLWYQLINKGCNQLVLQSNKIKIALFKLVHENSLLILPGTLPVLIPVIVDDVKQHIMDCAAIMRALKNEGMSGARHYNVAAGLKNKMVGVHMQVLGPILQTMEFSDLVLMEPGMPCPLSPPIDLASIPLLPPSKLEPGMPSAHLPWPLSPPIDLASIPLLPPSKLVDLGDCTPTKSQRIERKITPEKLMSGKGGCDVQVGDSSMGKGLDPEVVLDEHGWPTLFGAIIMSEVSVDEYGYPTIFGDIIEGMEAMQDDDSLPSMAEGKEAKQDDDSLASMAEVKEAMHDDDSLPSIKPINPNVRARKLAVNAAAKALLEDDLAKGVAPTVKKILKSKQPTKKTKNLKTQMIQQWHQSEEDPQEADASKEPHTKRVSKRAKCTGPKEDEPKAEGDAQAQQVRTACNRGIKNADAVIMSAHGSSNASTGRFDIQGKCKLADGSIKPMGILGFYEQQPFGEEVWKALLKKINDESGEHTKGAMLMLRDELIACCKAGHPC